MPSATTERPLFSGKAGTDYSWAWVQDVPEGLRISSQSIGSGASGAFGGGDVETFLTIPTARLEQVRLALLADMRRAPRRASVADLIARKWPNSSMVTTLLRNWLDERGIEYAFYVY